MCVYSSKTYHYHDLTSHLIMALIFKRLFYVNRDECITKSSPVTTPSLSAPPTQSGVGTISPTSLTPSLISGTVSPIVTSPLDEKDDTGWPTWSPETDIASSNVDVSDKESCFIHCI